MLRASLFALMAWVPPIILAFAQGLAMGGRGALLEDAHFHARFLFSLPVLAIAELVIDPRIDGAVSYLVEAELITKENRAGLDSAVARMTRRRDSLVQLALVPLAYALSFQDFRMRTASQTPTWMTLPGSHGNAFSLAGIWDHAVSTPLFVFFLLLALWRFVIWAMFLTEVARGPLNMAPTHPDKAGGLGFIASAQGSFALIILAASASLASRMWDIAHQADATPLIFQTEMVVFVLLAPLLFWIPLVVFTPVMIRNRKECLLRFGAKAGDYSHRFEKEWIWSRKPINLTNTDLSSDNDLGEIFERARAMRTILFDTQALAMFVIAAGLPMLVVIAQAVSLPTIAERIIRGLV